MLRRLVLASLLLSAVARAQCPPATKPVPPPDGTITAETNIAFAWTPAGTAVTGYDLYVASNGGAPQRLCFNSPSPNCSATLAAGNYEWFVRNFRDDCLTGAEPPHVHLQINACSASAAPATLAPDGGIEVSASALNVAQ